MMRLASQETGPSQPIRQTEAHSKRLYMFGHRPETKEALQSQ